LSRARYITNAGKASAQSALSRTHGQRVCEVVTARMDQRNYFAVLLLVFHVQLTFGEFFPGKFAFRSLSFGHFAEVTRGLNAVTQDGMKL